MNRESYNKIARSWDEARMTLYGREGDYLDTFLNGLPVPSSILDLGCGTGRPMAENILAHGHRVTGVDQAEALLGLARTRFPQGSWVQSRIEDFKTEDRFSGLICWDSLFHIERTHHSELLTRMARMLLGGGRLMITIGGSEHPAFTDDMFGETFFYDSYPPEKILSILDELGFELLISELMNVPTTGRDKGRYAIVASLA